MLKDISKSDIGKEFTLEAPDASKGQVKLVYIDDEDVILENISGYEELERINHLPTELIEPGTEKCFYLKQTWFNSLDFKLYV